MAEKSTIARPYAQAAFDLAQAEGNLAAWTDMLQLAAAVVADEQMQDVVNSPALTTDQIAGFMLKVCGDKLSKVGQQYIRVLAANRRLNVLDDIVSLFEQRRAEAESKIDAEVVSAFELTPAQLQALSDGLKKRLNRDVQLTTRVDESIIGGAIVRAGDLVIDGSVTGQLDKLAQSLLR